MNVFFLFVYVPTLDILSAAIYRRGVKSRDWCNIIPAWQVAVEHYRCQQTSTVLKRGSLLFFSLSVAEFRKTATMEDAKKKEKKQSEKTEEKEIKPTGKDKDKKDEQELVSWDTSQHFEQGKQSSVFA